MVKNLMFLACFSGILAFALADGHGKQRVENEDLRFIHEWQKSQRYADLASALNLNADQIGQLKAMRGEVDRVKAEFQNQTGTLKAQLEASAKELRQKLEAGGPLEDTDRDNLKSIRDQMKRMKREERLKLGLAVLDIGSVLNEDQVRILKQTAARHLDRGKHRFGRDTSAGKASAEGEQTPGAQRGLEKNRQGKSTRIARHLHLRNRAGLEGRLARILLSDEFLKNLG